jgi:hypothetical protein
VIHRDTSPKSGGRHPHNSPPFVTSLVLGATSEPTSITGIPQLFLHLVVLLRIEKMWDAILW